MVSSNDKAAASTRGHYSASKMRMHQAVRKSDRCQCRRNGLPCTDLCSCCDEENEPCQNVFNDVVDDDDDCDEE